ncbi:MAG: zinc ribbon domain-containing protein [Deltaproteobacteria bacterium]|jgi:putative FmdB family regulatory protein|nr:zinc ribbon domain-containing protein [Deltaproteobacteria bacterium]
MPLYEYECHNCQQVTEALQKFSDQPLTVCPKCGGQLSKLMSMNSFSLKGSGWYATDYAKSGAHDKAKTADKAEKPAATNPCGSCSSGQNAPASCEKKLQAQNAKA